MNIIGIDLGTSSSAAAALRNAHPSVIPSADGPTPAGKAFPSYVAVTAGGEILVGEPARRQAAANPAGTITAFKRRLGRREIIRLRDHVVSPEQLSAFLVQKIARDAELFLGTCVLRAVVGVPAYFDERQRRATRYACAMAGVEPVQLIEEPVAASLAYGLGRRGQEMCIAVIDLGGGAFDVTIVELGAGVFEVRATRGDTRLGGIDMTERLFKHLADGFHRSARVDVRGDLRVSARLREAAELAVIELSSSASAQVSLPFLASTRAGAQHLDIEITRAELDRLIAPILARCRQPVERVLADAEIRPQNIDRLVLVGGPTRIPAVRAFFEDLLGRPAEAGVDPMTCVACGAAIQAGVLTGEVDGIVFVDATSRSQRASRVTGVRLSIEEKRRMIEEAERRAEEDRRREARHAPGRRPS